MFAENLVSSSVIFARFLTNKRTATIVAIKPPGAPADPPILFIIIIAKLRPKNKADSFIKTGKAASSLS